MLLKRGLDREGDTNACDGNEVVPACMPHAGERVHLRVHANDARLVRGGGGGRVREDSAPGGRDSEVVRGHVEAVRRDESNELVMCPPGCMLCVKPTDRRGEGDALFLPGDLGVVPNVEA